MRRRKGGRKQSDRYYGSYSYKAPEDICNFISAGAGAPKNEDLCACCQKPYGEHKLKTETSTYNYSSYNK